MMPGPAARQWIMSLVDLLSDLMQAGIAGTGLLFAGWVSMGWAPVTPILAQVLTPMPQQPSGESILEFALRQGGAFAILLIVLFYYRRDYRDLTSYRQERDALLVQLVEKAAQAQTEMSAALRENNIVVHQAKNVLNDVLRDYVTPVRRASDPLPPGRSSL